MKKILFIFVTFFIMGNSYGQDNVSPELYIFIGEKISITEMPFQEDDEESNEADENGEFEILRIIVNTGYKAKYKIIENITGNLKSDTIEFTTWVHHGPPELTYYKYALIYLVKEGDEFLNLKYQFSPLFKTKDNRWASMYSPDYRLRENKKTKIKPEKIEFREEVFIPLEDDLEQDTIDFYYPAPFFKVEKNKAIAVYGNYIPELIQLKKEGTLKEYFKENTNKSLNKDTR